MDWKLLDQVLAQGCKSDRSSYGRVQEKPDNFFGCEPPRCSYNDHGVGLMFY